MTIVPDESAPRLPGIYTRSDSPTPAAIASARRAARDWAWQQPGLDPTAKLILLAYADHVRTDGQTTLGVPRLAELVGVSTRNVRRWQAVLRDRGLLVEGDQSLVAHHRADQRPVVYRLPYEPLAEVVQLRGDASDTPLRHDASDTPSRGVDNVTPLTSGNENPRGDASVRPDASDTQGVKALGSTSSLRSDVERRRDGSTDARRAEQAANRPKVRRQPEPPRPDVDRLCALLADHVERTADRRPPITAGWRRDMRLLLDRDGRTEQQVTKCIEWVTGDDFWAPNILCPSKLRKQYDTLRAHAKRAAGNRRGVSSGRTIIQPLSPQAFEEIDPNGGFR